MSDPLPALDLEKWLAQLVERAHELLPFESGGIAIYDSPSDRLRIYTYEAVTPDWQPSEMPPPGLFGTVALTRQATLSGEEGTVDPSARAAIGAPILLGERFLGAFVVESTQTGAYEPYHLTVLQSLADQAALALYMMRSGILAVRHDETEALLRIAAITSSTLDLDEILEHVVHEVAGLFEVEGAFLMMPNAEQNRLVVHIRSAYGLARSLPLGPLPVDSAGAAVHAYHTGQPVFSNRPSGDPALPWRNALIAPLNTRERTLGIFCLINCVSGDFEVTQLNLLRAFASQIATSMENAQFLAAERQRADLMALVSQISQELTATLSLPDLTRKVVRAIHERLGYETVSLMLLDESGLRLVTRALVSSVPCPAVVEGDSLAITEGIVGRAVRTGETQLVASLAEDGDSMQPDEGSALVVVLRYGTRIVGAIEALAPRANGFNQTDCMVLETLAAQVSVAVENARLWDQARRRLLEQDIVHQIGQDLTSILEYNELINAVVKHMTYALDTALCLLVSYDSANDQAVIEAEYRLPQLDEWQAPSFVGRALANEARDIILGVIHNHRQTIVTREDEQWRDYFTAAGIHAQCVVPMVAGERVIGCVAWLETRQTRHFTGADVRLAQTLTSQAAITLENARLFRQAQQQAREQALLRRVVVNLSIMVDTDSLLLQLAYEVSHALAGVNNVVIALKRATQQFELRAHHFQTCDADDMLLSHLQNHPALDTMLVLLEQGTSLQANAASVEADHPLAGYFQQRKVSVLLTPIMRRREMIGMIEVAVDLPSRRFETQEVQLLEALVNQGAIVLDNVGYRELEQRRLFQLEKLQASSRHIAGQLRTTILLDTIVREAAAIFDAPAVSLMTREPDSRYYVVRAAVGLSERYARERRPPVRDHDDVQTFTRADDNGFQDSLITAEGLSNVISIPLLKAGQQLGVLNIYGKETPRVFNEEEKELARLFSGQAAIALENASLFEALEEHAVELAKANQLKSEFLARVSHELRTPMNSINGYSEMLLREIYGPLTDKQADRIERVLRNGRNLLALINDLLDISKIEAGKMELSIERVNLAAEVAATIENLGSQAASRGLYLHLEPADELPLVYADPIRLRQVINNLLSNAIKFTKQGGVTVSTSVVEENGVLNAWTTVADTGIGIRREDQAIIFDEFRQVDGSTTREYSGTGLGLAITKKLVELMHGRIWVESEIGHGSAFTFVLPVALPADDPAAQSAVQEG